ncbi:MAG: MotA/TolQ/ExbB proton channel family protein, partial [Planctomycetales bacterium]|nr:MotA/TolQ/ExbB proton channel family protein [Planctomycetales bacterium]
TIVKVFIWALPILGFIGTVIGISAAVGGLGGSLESSSDVSALKGALNSVFDGLKTAFDTTLLALIMSMMVKIPASALQKSEQDLVTQVDEYCNENLLRRLNDGRDGGAERGASGLKGIDASVFRQAVEEGMATHQVELEKWLKKLDAIGSKLTSQVAQGWEEINARIQQQQLESSHESTRRQQEIAEQIDQQLAHMSAAASQIQETLSGVAEQAALLQGDVAQGLAQSSETMQNHFVGLERGLGSLTGVLERLGEQQVLVQQVEAPKRGWFSFGRNGRR